MEMVDHNNDGFLFYHLSRSGGYDNSKSLNFNAFIPEHHCGDYE